MSKKASELAEQLLGIHYTGAPSAVEGVMHSGGCHFGGDGTGVMDKAKEFYAANRTPVLAVSAVAAVAVIGAIGYAVYKKWIWDPASQPRRDDQ